MVGRGGATFLFQGQQIWTWFAERIIFKWAKLLLVTHVLHAILCCGLHSDSDSFIYCTLSTRSFLKRRFEIKVNLTSTHMYSWDGLNCLLTHHAQFASVDGSNPSLALQWSSSRFSIGTLRASHTGEQRTEHRTEQRFPNRSSVVLLLWMRGDGGSWEDSPPSLSSLRRKHLESEKKVRRSACVAWSWLFLISINDGPTWILCIICRFADDCVVYREISSDDDVAVSHMNNEAKRHKMSINASLLS